MNNESCNNQNLFTKEGPILLEMLKLVSFKIKLSQAELQVSPSDNILKLLSPSILKRMKMLCVTNFAFHCINNRIN